MEDFPQNVVLFPQFDTLNTSFSWVHAFTFYIAAVDRQQQKIAGAKSQILACEGIVQNSMSACYSVASDQVSPSHPFLPLMMSSLQEHVWLIPCNLIWPGPTPS